MSHLSQLWIFPEENALIGPYADILAERREDARMEAWPTVQVHFSKTVLIYLVNHCIKNSQAGTSKKTTLLLEISLVKQNLPSGHIYITATNTGPTYAANRTNRQPQSLKTWGWRADTVRFGFKALSAKHPVCFFLCGGDQSFKIILLGTCCPNTRFTA